MTQALFTLHGDTFVPSEHTRGPWDPRAQHAGPPAALLGRAMEAVDTELPMQIVRFTIELLRPVPLTPLRAAASVERGSRRVQLLEATLHAGDTEVARARAVRIRTTEVALPEFGGALDATVDPPEQSIPHRPFTDEPAFHETGVELRFARGAFGMPGAATVWIRLRHPLLEGEEPTPLQRTLAAADFGNGVSALADWREYLFINPDLTVHQLRPLAGDWVCLEAHSWLQPGGTGLAHSVLHDVRGPMGYAVQSLLFDRRAAQPG